MNRFVMLLIILIGSLILCGCENWRMANPIRNLTGAGETLNKARGELATAGERIPDLTQAIRSAVHEGDVKKILRTADLIDAKGDQLITQALRRIDQAEAHLDKTQDQMKSADRAALGKMLRWLIVLSILGAAAGGALVWFGSAKMGIGVIVASASAAVGAYSISAILPYTEWIALGVVLLVLGAGAYFVYINRKAIHDALQLGQQEGMKHIAAAIEAVKTPEGVVKFYDPSTASTLDKLLGDQGKAAVDAVQQT